MTPSLKPRPSEREIAEAERVLTELAKFEFDYGWEREGMREIIASALQDARRAALEEAAHVAEQFGSHILRIYSRGPGSPPGNQYVPLTGQHVADAIRCSLPSPSPSPGGKTT